MWLLLALNAALFAAAAWGAGLAFAADAVLRRRHGLGPADLGEAVGRGLAGALLFPAVAGMSLAINFLLFAGTPAAGSVPPFRPPAWAGRVFVVACTHLPAAAAVYASFTTLRAAAPRREVFLVSAVGSFVWLAGLWGAGAALAWVT